MDSSSELTLGSIPYLNCVPFFYHLKKNGFRGKLVTGVPSELNQMLQRGELDASPSSSFEYARNWRDYFILPDHSISSVGTVRSVLLFSPVELAELEGCKVAMTGESATSINLLRIIFREFVGLKCVTDWVPDVSIETLIAQGQPALLIGDRALRLSLQLPEGVKTYDLGELWFRYTGLPFVFALWMVRRTVLGRFSGEFDELGSQLLKSREQLISDPYPFAAVVAESVKLDVDVIVDYWNTIDFRLEAVHLQGLQLFFHLCMRYNLLDSEPELIFVK
ncbi:MAG: menaquinone biosynthesis protein [Thermodesulfobacteriota bacterium]|nr:menaquinone biosynthesis protein [Thermodesulfobacteriota bacterium]